MPSLDPRTVIGETDCPCCGSAVALAVTKTGQKVYAICKKQSNGIAQPGCGWRTFYPLDYSQSLIREYQDARRKAENETPDHSADTGAETAIAPGAGISSDCDTGADPDPGDRLSIVNWFEPAG